MKTKLLSILFFLLPATSHAWEIFTESGTDGREITIAEQVGDAGSFLTLVCVDQKIHIEIIFPGAIDLDDDSVVLLQIDNQPERLVAGFFDKIDATTSVFVGLDRRDEPSAATSDLLKQMAAGNSLYLGNADLIEAIEHWSMAGSRKAIKQIKSKCSQISVARPELLFKGAPRICVVWGKTRS